MGAAGTYPAGGTISMISARLLADKSEIEVGDGSHIIAQPLYWNPQPVP